MRTDPHADSGNATATATDRPNIWSTLTYWLLHAWILGYSGVLVGAFTIQFVAGEFPCPLCMLQRYGMILSTLGAVWIVAQARRGELTTSRYAQGLGMGVVAAVAGATVSVRQILLHILPGDPGYGEPVLGLHLYTWAFITFTVVVLFVGVMAMLMPKGIPVAPPAGSGPRLVSTIVLGIFVALVVANVVAIILLEGFAWVLPDDPTDYNLLNQLGIG